MFIELAQTLPNSNLQEIRRLRCNERSRVRRAAFPRSAGGARILFDFGLPSASAEDAQLSNTAVPKTVPRKYETGETREICEIYRSLFSATCVFSKG